MTISGQLPSAPIVVAGMHRSGTTLLARLLAAAGVYSGRTLTANFESAFFQQINRDLLDQLGCSWACVDELPPVGVLATRFEILKTIVANRLHAGLASDYFGEDAGAWPEFWGWKDPRNCLTLPFWQRFFPDARVVFIYRHPRDVAASLIARAEHAYAKGHRFDAAEAQRRFRQYVALWDVYNRRALEGMAPFPVTVTIRYEDLLADPGAHMAQLTSTIGLDAHSALTDAVRQVRPERAWAFDGGGDERLRDLPVESELFERWYGDRSPRAVPARAGDAAVRS